MGLRVCLLQGPAQGVQETQCTTLGGKQKRKAEPKTRVGPNDRGGGGGRTFGVRPTLLFLLFLYVQIGIPDKLDQLGTRGPAILELCAVKGPVTVTPRGGDLRARAARASYLSA
eukprot:5023114-Amphidinium_carterae.1